MILERQIDPTKKTYIFYTQESRLSRILPLSKAVSRLMVENGYDFISATTNIQTNYCSNVGLGPYYVKYTDFDAFQNNFETDLADAESTSVAETGGWVSHLVYESITFVFRKDSERIDMAVHTRGVNIRLHDLSRPFDLEQIRNCLCGFAESEVITEERSCYL